ncbi:MAG: hypothetical protein U5L95_05070 [Candidatus Saccharibacteria bacterium]|nr:hypothetical protein [Candidatus Saccharibacteria bacterium]
MINLLPTEHKQANSYGLKNRALVRWIIALIIGIVGIWAIVGFGYYQLERSVTIQEQNIADAQQRLKEQDLDGVQTQTEEIDTSIQLAIKALERKVLFSDLLQKIGAVIPEDAVLEGVSIEEFDGGIDLTAKAKNYESATQIQVNLADPENGVFTDADITSINCNTPENEYPCTVNLRALFDDDSQFLFINQTVEQADE